jgi:hypothetical protein
MTDDGLLERCMKVAVIVAALSVTGRVGWMWFHDRAPERDAARVAARPIRGVLSQEVRPLKDRGGLMLFVSPTCPYCEASLAFYRQLAGTAGSVGVPLLVAVTDHGRDYGGDQYIREKRIENVVPVKLAAVSTLGLKGTPTILAFDENGRVTKSWVGKLNAEREREVELTIGALAAVR